MGDFFTDKNGVVHPISGKNGGGGGGGIVAVVLAVALAAGGGGLGTATSVGGAVDSVAGQSIHAKAANGKNAAGKGQYDEAWRRMGLKSFKNSPVERELKCAVHSYDQVREFFAVTPCRSLHRRLLALDDSHGNIFMVSIVWVRMPNADSAQQLKQLIDTHGTGDVNPLASEILELRGIRFTGKHYDSRRAGSLVVIAEVEPVSGQPDTELLDSTAQVAAQFPPP